MEAHPEEQRVAQLLGSFEDYPTEILKELAEEDKQGKDIVLEVLSCDEVYVFSNPSFPLSGSFLIWTGMLYLRLYAKKTDLKDNFDYGVLKFPIDYMVTRR